jgi:hypothetical protein
MINVEGLGNTELAHRVVNDNYFMVERENRDYLLALVAEEFFYTPKQKDVLIELLDAYDKDSK